MSRTLSVENPADASVAGSVPDMTQAEIEEIARAARAAQAGWAELGFDGRARILRGLRDWLVDNRERVIDALVTEGGKTRDDALVTDWTYVCTALELWTARAREWLADERVAARSPLLFGRELTLRHVPRGLVGVIGPWNFPLSLCFGDAIPALMAGNAVLLKPASLTPLSSVVVAEGFAAAGGPDGVLNVVTGTGAGAAVTDAVDMVMFTGSTDTGRKIAERAGRRLIPASLELGGNDPMIVLADADLDRAVSTAVHGGMFNAGQVCQSVERVYVERPVYEDFLRGVAEVVGRLRVGAAGGPGTVEVGALVDPEQLAIVTRQVAAAVQSGARLVVGGEGREAAGRFFSPTVLADCTPDMEIMREETFGPVLAVTPVDDADEALKLANDTAFGLSASVFTADEAAGEELARRVEAGGVFVNDVLLNALAFEAPFGGWKTSGVGARNGPEGIRKYCRQQLVGVTRVAPASELYHYPLDPRRSQLLERTLVAMQRQPGRVVGSALSVIARTPVVRAAAALTTADRRRRAGRG